SGAIVHISSGSAIGPGRGPYADAAVGARGGTCYGAEKAALERMTQGLASEVYQYGISVTSVAPSQVVPTPGTVYHQLVKGMDDPRGEPPILMERDMMVNGDYSYICHQKWGDNFALVGDASAFIDPIFSTGVFMA